MKNKKEVVVSGRVGFVTLLQLAFIVLRLCNVITWSWWLVMLPYLICGGILIIALLIVLVCWIIDRRNYF